jgi:hypothetical protein
VLRISAFSLPGQARIVHEFAAGLAILAIVGSFFSPFAPIVATHYPVASLSIAGALALGSALARRAFVRMRQLAADEAVSALLREESLASETAAEDSLSDPLIRRTSRTWESMPIQIALTAIVAAALVLMPEKIVQRVVTESASSPSACAPATPTDNSGGAQQKTRTDNAPEAKNAAVGCGVSQQARPLSDLPDWALSPAIVAIVLSEFMYVGWMFEGEAIAEDLVLLSRRWDRRRRIALAAAASERSATGPAAPPPAAEARETQPASPPGGAAPAAETAAGEREAQPASPSGGAASVVIGTFIAAPSAPSSPSSDASSPPKAIVPVAPAPPFEQAKLYRELLMRYGVDFVPRPPELGNAQ